MSTLLLDYLPLVVFIAVALAIGLALLIAPFIVAYKQPDPEKLSAYECGFNAFDDARMGDTGAWVAGDIDAAAARERKHVRHRFCTTLS